MVQYLKIFILKISIIACLKNIVYLRKKKPVVLIYEKKIHIIKKDLLSAARE